MFGGTTVLNTLWSKGTQAVTPVVGAFQGQPGVVCCDRATTSQRAIVLNAWVNVRKLQRQQRDANGNVVLDPGTNKPVIEDYLSGQLAATARVSLDDYSTAFAASDTPAAGDPPQVFDPGFDVRVERFQACALARLPLSFDDVRRGTAANGGADGLDPDLAAARRDGPDTRCQDQ